MTESIPFPSPTFSIASRNAKSALTVESQFDPTKIKKAEVVLRELLGEHGRQFAESDAAVRTHRFQQRGNSRFQN